MPKTEASTFFVQSLKDEVQKKFGKEIYYGKDCMALSEEIKASTNRHISITTLKRFFNIVKSSFNPSRFTLDTFSIYLEFINWQDFINSFEEEKHTFSHEDSWEQLKKRARLVTDYSLKSMHAKLGKLSDKFPLRQFADKKTEAFLESPQKATAFIAPEGLGKTLLMTQLVEKYFTGENALYPYDIICLIDGRILIKLLSLDFKINRLYNLLEFDPKHSFSNYFRQNPEQVKGRFILIIDAINEIFAQPEKLSNFIDNLLKIVSSYESVGWFKLIVSCHPDTWQTFRYLMNKNPLLKSYWFDVSYSESIQETINVPLLETNEIASILKHNHSSRSLEEIQFHFPQILDIINHPYFLHLFLEVQKTSDIHTDIELLYQFLHDRILSDPLAEDKINLIDAFFKACDNCQKSMYVVKEELLRHPDSGLAFKELISAEIFQEYKVPGSYLSLQTYVEFTHSILMEFFLANKWLKESSLNMDLLRTIMLYYDNIKLQCSVLKYIIKIAFKEENTRILKDIYSIFQGPSDNTPVMPMNDAYNELLTIVGLELRKNKKLRDELIPFYAKEKNGQIYYFERFFDMDCLVLHTGADMDYYMKYNTSEKAQSYGHFMKFMQYFLASDTAACEKEYNIVKQLSKNENTSFLKSNFFYCVLVIYQSVFLKKIDPNLMKDIYANAKQLRKQGDQKAGSQPIFEIAIIFALNYGNLYDEIIELTEYIIDKYNLTEFPSSAYYQLFKAIYARAKLNTGHTSEAFKIFNEVDFKNVPVNVRYYMTLRYKLIKVEFLIAGNQPKEVILDILKEIKTAAKMLRFYYFYQMAERIEKNY